MRVDKKKNNEKIIKEVMQNPLQSQREIAKNTGLGKTTVQEHLQELPKTTKDDRIIALTDTDFDIVVLAQQRIRDKLEDDEEMKKTRIGEISGVAKESAARYSIFRGELTAKDGTLKEQPLTLKQIEAIEAIEKLMNQ